MRPVSIICPIKGLDHGLKENLIAITNLDCPKQVLFILDDENEPGLPIAKEFGEVVLCGSPEAGQTGKLNAMIAGLKHAKHDLIAFIDSDTRPYPNTLKVLQNSLTDDAGSAFAPVATNLPPKTIGDSSYAVMLNGMYGATAKSAFRKANFQMPFIMGQCMLLKREAIEAIGGLEDATGQLVDDMYLGRRINEAGYKNIVAPIQVPIIQQHTSFIDFFKLYRKWIAFSKTGLPISFKVLPWIQAGLFWASFILFFVFLYLNMTTPAILSAVVPFSIAYFINRANYLISGIKLRAHHSLAIILVMLMGPAVMLSLMLKKKVSWRGRDYNLNNKGELDG